MSLLRLRSAIQSERRHGFVNLMGRQFRFADFTRQEVAQLLPEALPLLTDYERLEPDEREARLKAIESQMRAKEQDDWRSQPVQFVKGVGPRLAEILAKLNVFTAYDLIRYYPRKHLNYANRVPIAEVAVGLEVTIAGRVKRVECFPSPRNANLTILSVVVQDESGLIKATWFYGRANRYLQEQYKKRFPVGQTVLLSGVAKADSYTGKPALDRPEAELLGDEGEDGQSLHVGRILPVYPLTEGLSLKVLRRAIRSALDLYGDKLKDPLPEPVRRRHQLMPLAEALPLFHFPETLEQAEQARKRLVFDELLHLQLALLIRRAQQQRVQPTIALEGTGRLVEQFLTGLPFQLTGAQRRVLEEVVADLRADRPMNRLVQGDVGSGKTVVAVAALLAAIQEGYQGALMVPTEILAEQHAAKCRQWLEPLGLRVATLLGSQRARERREVMGEIQMGSIDLVVGTHALIQEGVAFRRLGLVVIDEQHRFGVKQRALLRGKGQTPEVLTMTATPIPRTLALAMHGDLDVSTIDELPPGRQPVATHLVTGKGKRKVWEWVAGELMKGRQAYVIYPLIEESEKLDVKAATEAYLQLKDDVFPQFRVGLLHGQMASADKDAVMGRFVRGELDLLVSTTVIEVGVDVPNATVMVIENAERFGLAQLHQLRGRVGRGADQSYCFLMADRLSEAGRQRLEIMTKTNNGFVIAEQDLRLRGPGEFLGTRQSGLPDLLLADLVSDTALLESAREAAVALTKADPLLTRNPLLLSEVQRHLRGTMDFLDVG